MENNDQNLSILSKLHECLDSLENSRRNNDDWEHRYNIIRIARSVKELLSSSLVRKTFGPHYSTLVSQINDIVLDPTQHGGASAEDVVRLHHSLSKIIVDVIDDLNLNDVAESENESAYLSKSRIEADNELAQIKSHRQAIEALHSELKKEKTYLENEKRSVLEEQQKFDDFKAKVTIAVSELDFQTVALKNRKTSNWWLTASIILFGGVFLYVLTLGKHVSTAVLAAKKSADLTKLTDPSQIMSAIQYSLILTSITHLIMLSILICALMFCVKNYTARMHNYIVNIQRAAALSSTMTLLGTAKSDAGNDQILMQSCQAIFCHQKSGFSGKDGEIQSPNIISQLIEKASR